MGCPFRDSCWWYMTGGEDFKKHCESEHYKNCNVYHALMIRRYSRILKRNIKTKKL